MACNREQKPPALIANARAGSKVSFMWSPWYMSHKGPIITYMAPYDGSIDKVDVNALKFFKISEFGLAPDNRTWATDKMIENGNITTATIPHDIKSGNYILRHELISLHYATEDSQYEKKVEKPLGSQVSLVFQMSNLTYMD
jgi:cellulase